MTVQLNDIRFLKRFNSSTSATSFWPIRPAAERLQCHGRPDAQVLGPRSHNIVEEEIPAEISAITVVQYPNTCISAMLPYEPGGAT
jgi:hypothetical protein